MADLDLDALEALRAAATQGEWEADNYDGWHIQTRHDSAMLCTLLNPRARAAANAKLIVALHNNLPALLSLARTGAARVPSGSDLEAAARVLREVMAAETRGDNMDTIIAAALARAREEEREAAGLLESARAASAPKRPAPTPRRRK